MHFSWAFQLYHSSKSSTSRPKSWRVFLTKLNSSTSMAAGMGLNPYFCPPKNTKLGPRDISLQLRISSKQMAVVEWSSVASSRVPHLISIIYNNSYNMCNKDTFTLFLSSLMGQRTIRVNLNTQQNTGRIQITYEKHILGKEGRRKNGPNNNGKTTNRKTLFCKKNSRFPKPKKLFSDVYRSKV